jgi:RND family efflux transporter MFP subunit
MDKDSKQRVAPQLAVVKTPDETGDSAESGKNVRPGIPEVGMGAAMDASGTEANGGAVMQPASLTVCVVDDSYSSLRTIFKALKERGHALDHFAGVEEAYAALGKREYDVLIISESVAGGPALCDALIARIRQDSDATIAHMPILALSADTRGNRQAVLRRAGASAVVVGDFSDEQIYQAVVQVLGGAAAPAATVRARRVLFVEDSYSLSLLLSEALTRAGHEVDHFSLATEALPALLAKRYDCLVIGQNDRGGVTCADVVARVHSTFAARGIHLPVLVLTDDATPANVGALRRAGADRVVTKNATELEKHVVNLVGRGMADPQSPAPERKPAPPPTPEATPAAVSTPPPASSAPAAPPPVSGSGDPASSPAQARKAKRPRFASYAVPGVLVAVAVAAGGGGWLWQNSGVPVPVEVVNARVGSVARSTPVTGYVVSKRQVDLAPTQTGQLFRVYVEEGNLVRKGETLATLDNREAVINVRRAEALVFRYRTEIQLANRALSQFRAQAQQTVSQQALLDLESSKALGEAKLRLAQEDLGAAELAVQRLAIVAPFAGEVTQSFAIDGRWVEAGVPVFTLADLDSREVVLQVSGVEASEIRLGSQVWLSVEGDARGEWKEKIVRIPPPAVVGEAAGRATTPIYVSLGEDGPDLELGQRVLAQVVTDSASNTVKVPFEAVFERDGRSLVAVLDGTRVRYQTVQTGVMSGTDLEIVDGLKVGDAVVLPRNSLRDGQRVEAAYVESIPLDVEGYPHRARYTDVKTMTTPHLRDKFDRAVIVDVRSRFEYDVAHIANAQSVPFGGDNFLAQLQPLRAKDGSDPLVFYCNGHACEKSYAAARSAASAGFANVFAYDSGMLDWMREQPHLTALFDMTPAPARKMVSDDYFRSRLLSFGDFQKKAQADNAVVVDLRDTRQGAASLPLPVATHVPLDKIFAQLGSGDWRDKQLLIADSGGEQVRWLQYLLEDRGYKNYFFLRGGIEGLKQESSAIAGGRGS